MICIGMSYCHTLYVLGSPHDSIVFDYVCRWNAYIKNVCFNLNDLSLYVYVLILIQHFRLFSLRGWLLPLLCIKSFILIYRSFDFDDGTFSPPTGDDGFFLIRYKKPEEELAVKPKVTTATKCSSVSSYFEVKKDVNLRNHTSSCKEFIPNAKLSKSIGILFYINVLFVWWISVELLVVIIFWNI